MTQWNRIKLKDVADIIGGGTPSTKKSEFWNGSIVWITPKDLSGYKYKYISQGERNITQLGLENSSARMLPKNSVLMTSRAPIGYVAIAKQDVCTNQGFKSLVLKDKNVPEFFYYLLKNNENYIKNMASGSTFAEISGSQVQNLEFQIPDIETQEKIAKVLGAIDDKIELNNKINENLEQQAQAIFKSWFVDFEPFGGIMPDSWIESQLSEIVNFLNGYAFKSNDLLKEKCKDSLDVFKQGHINRGGGFNISGTKSWINQDKIKGLDKYILKKGDVLMAMTDMKDNVAILGNTAIMPIDNKYIVNQRVGLLRCNDKYDIGYPFVYLLTNSEPFLSNLRKRANSGVQVNLSSEQIKISKVNIPTKEIIENFKKISLPMFEKLFNNQIENERLAKLRDTLLPKLMSGELDVNKVEV